MHALAMLVMRGMLWAIVVTVISFSLPVTFWIGSAVVSLITLRHGVREGAILLLFALLTIGCISWLSGQQQLESLFCLLGSFSCAVVLRLTSSWALSLLLFVPVMSLLNVLALEQYTRQVNEVLRVLTQEFGNLSELIPADSGMTSEQLMTILSQNMLKSISFIMGVSAVISLILARYWQATLYNPGGFGQEFRRLNFSLPVVFVLVGSWLGLSMADNQSSLVAVVQPIVLVPLLLAGTAVVHAIVKFRKMGTGWLILYYILMFAAYPLMITAAILLCCLDSAFGIRKRFAISEQN